MEPESDLPAHPFPGDDRPGEFQLFFGNEDFNSSIADCGDVFPVTRVSGEEGDVVRESLLALLAGPSGEELGQKYYTYLNPGIKLLGLRSENGILYVDFSSELEKDVAGSCDTIAIRAQITRTLEQFEGVDRVVILVEGKSEDVLQP